MAVKFSLSTHDTSKKFSTSSSAWHGSSRKEEHERYPASQVRTAPLTKSAQATGAAGIANVMYTQPMFFSPLHTAQNWQIASKRREISQWSFISPCFLTSYEDGSLVDISDLYIHNDQIELQDGMGKRAKYDILTKRHVNKKANSIKVLGTCEPIVVTHDHDCRVIKRADIQCPKNTWNKKLCVADQVAPTCKRQNCSRCNGLNYHMSKIKAQDVKKGDFMLVPFSTEIKPSCIKTVDEAKYAGYLAADGWVYSNVGAGVCANKNEYEVVFETVGKIFNSFGARPSIEIGSTPNVLIMRSGCQGVSDFSKSLISGKGIEKKFTSDVVFLDPALQLHVLGAYIQSDGTYNKVNDNIEITTYSKHLANQLLTMFYRCGILARGNKQQISKSSGTFESQNTHRYIINVASSECGKIKDYIPAKAQDLKIRGKRHYKRFFWKNFVVSPVSEVESFDYDGDVYDVRVPPTYTITANGVSIYQCRFYYSNEPKVAACIDFLSQFPLNGFVLECKSKKVLKYFERLFKRIKLEYWLKAISFEYYLLGDVYPFVETECSKCGGSGYLPDGSSCDHMGGTIQRIKILNPDWITVHNNPIADEPVFTLEPDDELKQIITQKFPREIYDKLPSNLIASISSGAPIVLSNRCISHIKYPGSTYGSYGEAPSRRCFTYLAYKTKLMTANWIVAERLVLPIRIVKIGSDNRPASQADLSDVANQIAAVANDPNLTLVTHHAFEYSWEGATGRIHNITNEMEMVGKEILDGFMLNQAILNGEAGSYSGSQVGVEVMLHRLGSWRNMLSEWVETHIMLPVSMMQGFVDEEESKEAEETCWITPKIKWNDLHLRDNTQKLQFRMQLHDKGLISSQTLLEECDLNYDQEIQRKREEQIFTNATGQLLGQPQGGGMGGMGSGMGGLSGGIGGGALPMDLGGMGGPPLAGSMPGAPGGGMGAPGGMPPMGGAGPAPAGGAGVPVAAAQMVSPTPNFRVEKRGKGKSFEEQQKLQQQQMQQQQIMRPIQLTTLEQKMLRILQSMSNKVPYHIYPQYPVKLPGNPSPFMIDFAYPAIGVGIESNGEIWHENMESRVRDQQRDVKLANVGWRIIRFTENAITDHADEVSKVVFDNIMQATQDRAQRAKTAENDEQLTKLASQLLTFEGLEENGLKFEKVELPNNLGLVYLIGT